ncbi:uncharacterized protein LOC120293441 [Eucalyptus grandis]|uniref:uncharacterized protein LOC120293441 n=1 Tax=Eucalyptus grandis TaxID=71139 RepID=UPI00192EB331|nr:uncharacterized protein LOC120293441 [Eucalyptus grandis]
MNSYHWEALRRKKPRVFRHALVWNSAIMPRYQFNLWIMAKGRLPTQALLLSNGRIDGGSCPFCNEVPDYMDHLFFGCRVTADIAFFWAARCNIPWCNRSWAENLHWATTLLTGKDFYKSIARFSFGALCHIIWKNMNTILFRDEPLSVPAMKNHLSKVVKDKALTFRNVEDSTRNKRLACNWGCDPIIFSSRYLDPPTRGFLSAWWLFSLCLSLKVVAASAGVSFPHACSLCACCI